MSNDAESEWNFSQQRADHEHCHGAKRNDEVLANDAARAATEAERSQKIFQTVVHQYHFRLFERGIGTTRTHGHTDIGGGKAGRIVHTVTDHRDALTTCGKLANGLDLLLWL